jgi:HD superfamily phosphohydrolase
MRGVENGPPRLGIAEGGWHSAEALVLARYFMFTQVYFHKTRVAYDIHLREAMKELLPGGHFPKPIPGELEEYLRWDDWRVLGLLASGQGGEHGARLAGRNHYRLVYRTSEIQSETDRSKLLRVREALGGLIAAEMPAGKSWYKTGDTDIAVFGEREGQPPVAPLSVYSTVVRHLGENDQVLLYCLPERKSEADKKVKEALNGLE